MLAHMKTRTTGESTEISLLLPTKVAAQMRDIITNSWTLAGHKIRGLNAEGEELFSFEEVFPDSHPGSRLRGLRVREGLTQKRMAEKLGLRQHHISEMEKGTRPISLEMAKRISKTFDISYKVFL
ncbi:MAG: helix-turn-helix domain-containing protein [Candidatus Adiutrix sp.]|jgi:DNA-binding XRE family transcriptional regulator|nr:helix-turn-helix domain-containing protein [Candidatus Adiutrix sp.]